MFRSLQRFAPFAMFVIALTLQGRGVVAQTLVGTVSPNPAITQVKTAVSLNFHATLMNAPTPGQEMPGPEKDTWKITSVLESADGSSYGSPSPGDYTISPSVGTSGNGLSVTVKFTPIKPAYYAVTVHFESSYPSLWDVTTDVTATVIGIQLDIVYNADNPPTATNSMVIPPDKTQQTIVGLKIPLAANITPAGVNVGKYTWTITGSPKTSWSVDPDTGADGTAGQRTIAKDALAFTDVNATSVKFYWVTAGTYVVSLDVAVPNTTDLIAISNFNVVTPTSTLGAMYQADATVDAKFTPKPNVITLHYGDDIPHAGIVLNYSFSEPAPFTNGTIETVQVGHSIDQTATDSTTGVIYENKEGTAAGEEDKLDGYYPNVSFKGANANSFYTYDSPGLQTANIGDLVGKSTSYKDVSEDEQFIDWLMYKPSGDAEWVPLKNLTWGWKAHAYIDPTTNQWIIDPVNTPTYTRPASGTVTSKYPTWMEPISDQNWAKK